MDFSLHYGACSGKKEWGGERGEEGKGGGPTSLKGGKAFCPDFFKKRKKRGDAKLNADL